VFVSFSSLLSRSLPPTLVYLLGRARIRGRRVHRWFQQNGIRGVLAGLCGYPIRLFRRKRREVLIDQSLGAETRGSLGLWHARIPFDSFRYATGYEPSDPQLVRRLLRSLQQDFSEFAFVDIGCGKGRALIIAAEFGFNRLIGVEFVAGFAETARRNCRRLGIPAEIRTQDALEFEFPAGNLVIYLYNPFNSGALAPLLDQLLAAEPRECFVIYVNPIERSLLDSCDRMESIASDRDAAIWRIAPRLVGASD
jgi:hypothetical protein